MAKAIGPSGRHDQYKPRFAFVPLMAAWSMFCLSFALPATNVVERGGTPPGTPLLGWEACLTSLITILTQPLGVLVDPRALLFLAFPVMNVAMAGMPWFVLSHPEKTGSYAAALIPFGLATWMLSKSLTGDLLVGFYFWDLSAFVMAAGCIWLGRAWSWSTAKIFLLWDLELGPKPGAEELNPLRSVSGEV
jgi:hypothetical protein